MKDRFFKVADFIAKSGPEATKHVLFENERCNSVIWVVPPGKEVVAHYHPETDDVWIVLQGKGDYYIAKGETCPIEAGMVIPAEKGEIHGVKNNSGDILVFSAVSAPMPVQMIKVE